MGFFDSVEMASPDPIFSLNTAFSADSRSTKVNLGVGAYKSAELKPVVLSSVKKAEAELVASGDYKEYLPIDGDKEYLHYLTELLFGASSEAVISGRVYGAQTLGGTGALRLGADFLYEELGNRVYLSNPTWANHKPLFARAGYQIEMYPYYDRVKHCLDFEKLCSFLETLEEKSIVLLHGCCHNPTGMDLSFDQWKQVSAIMKGKKLFPFFDLAYQGFGKGLEEDVQAVRFFADEGHEMFLAYSCSKNFGLYCERVGALFALASSKKVAEKMGSKIKILIRQNYSNPPAHGARVVKQILSSPVLRGEWSSELSRMRERIFEMRKAFASGLLACGGSNDFSFMRHQQGMFSFSGLEKDHVDRLISEYGIYMPSSGRINVAGLSSNNLDYVVDAILAVL